MKINKYDSGLLHSCMYVVEDNGHAIIIDPCVNTDCAENLIIDFIVLTHEHYDHISGVNIWKEKTKAPVVCSEKCSVNIMDSKKNMSRYFDVFCEMQTWIPKEELHIQSVKYVCCADSTFNNTTSFTWQNHIIELMEIPGHSAGSIGIKIDNEHFFSGDSLLEKEPIELRFPGGSKKQWELIGKERIENLKKGIRIWPGHFDDFILF